MDPLAPTAGLDPALSRLNEEEDPTGAPGVVVFWWRDHYAALHLANLVYRDRCDSHSDMMDDADRHIGSVRLGPASESEASTKAWFTIKPPGMGSPLASAHHTTGRTGSEAR